MYVHTPETRKTAQKMLGMEDEEEDNKGERRGTRHGNNNKKNI